MTYKQQFETQRLNRYVAEGNNLYQAAMMACADCDVIISLSYTDDDLVFKDLLETNKDVLKTHHNEFVEAAITHLTTKPHPTYKVIL